MSEFQYSLGVGDSLSLTLPVLKLRRFLAQSAGLPQSINPKHTKRRKGIAIAPVPF